MTILRKRRWLVLGTLAALLVFGFFLSRRPMADALYQRASAEYQAGRHGSARRYVGVLSVLRRPTPFDRLLRGMLAASDQRLDEAFAELATIPDGHPLAPPARIVAGQAELRRGRIRDAETYFLDAVRLAPYALQARRELAYIYNIQHRQTEMDDQLEAFGELQTLNFAYVLLWSKTRTVGWSPKADMPTLRKYVDTDTDDRWSRLALAEGLRRQDDLDGAQALMDQLEESDPEGLAMRATLALDRGDFPTAESLIASGSRDNPALARLRGQLALRKRDADAAVEAYRIAYDADPLDRSSVFGLGTALHMRGDETAAAPYLAAARKQDALFAIVAYAATEKGEQDPEVPRKLGLACAEAGRIPEARAWLKLAIKNDPLDRSTQQSLYQLDKEHPPQFAGLSRTLPSNSPDGLVQQGSLAGVPRQRKIGSTEPVVSPR
ncbi:MAG: tetratricopeptide repeat protein [Paludisphaera borealis]|uniref:tetratricopeptide repeat protein n=1 Tax=Paludisphaera borealis TaxID=1387353 RepID=UPI00283E678C|nr:tetratricopeptide repeat protein [Paludisphaera borealis]MDR3621424.1 tetratricopeptide repeat protein [Paludisphaera borealis]